MNQTGKLTPPLSTLSISSHSSHSSLISSISCFFLTDLSTLTGFTKIVKKVEKETKIPGRAFLEKVKTANFFASEVLEDLTRETEDGFAAVFEGGDRKAALASLREAGKNVRFLCFV